MNILLLLSTRLMLLMDKFCLFFFSGCISSLWLWTDANWHYDMHFVLVKCCYIVETDIEPLQANPDLEEGYCKALLCRIRFRKVLSCVCSLSALDYMDSCLCFPFPPSFQYFCLLHHSFIYLFFLCHHHSTPLTTLFISFSIVTTTVHTLAATSVCDHI